MSAARGRGEAREEAAGLQAADRTGTAQEEGTQAAGDENGEAVDVHEAGTQLHAAVLAGDITAVQQFLRPETVGFRTKAGRTPLHEAVKTGKLEIARLLLQERADPDVSDSEGMTPLREVCEKDRVRLGALLLDSGADLHATDGHGQTLLHDCVLYDSVNFARLLLDRRADPQAADVDGLQPLHTVEHCSSHKLVSMLVARGADVRARDAEGWEVLHRVIERGDVELLELLMDLRADPRAVDGRGREPLHHAAREGRLDLAAFLLDYGADVHVRDDDGRSALDYMAVHGSKEKRALEDAVAPKLLVQLAVRPSPKGAAGLPWVCGTLMSGEEVVAMQQTPMLTLRNLAAQIGNERGLCAARVRFILPSGQAPKVPEMQEPMTAVLLRHSSQ